MLAAHYHAPRHGVCRPCTYTCARRVHLSFAVLFAVRSISRVHAHGRCVGRWPARVPLKSEPKSTPPHVYTPSPAGARARTRTATRASTHPHSHHILMPVRMSAFGAPPAGPELRAARAEEERGLRSELGQARRAASRAQQRLASRHVTNKAHQGSARVAPRRLHQRQRLPGAAPRSVQPRPVSRLGRP